MKTALALLLIMPAVFAHESQATSAVDVLLYASFMAGVAVLASLVFKPSRLEKKILFLAIVVPLVAASLYLAFVTVYTNVTSITGGPVHWHADYEIWICGEEVDLVDPEGIENRVGTPVVHEHGDNRIHVEGVLTKMEEASIGHYFESVGGSFTKTSITVPTNSGLVSKKNGDPCNGKAGTLKMYVNGQLTSSMDEYVIGPYPDVPPGDFIKFVFD